MVCGVLCVLCCGGLRCCVPSSGVIIINVVVGEVLVLCCVVSAKIGIPCYSVGVLRCAGWSCVSYVCLVIVCCGSGQLIMSLH